MRETILKVLEEWSTAQPNMESLACRELLAKDLHDAITERLNAKLAKADSQSNKTRVNHEA